MKNKTRIKQLKKLYNQVIKKEKYFLTKKAIWEENKSLEYWTKLDKFLRKKLISLE